MVIMVCVVIVLLVSLMFFLGDIKNFIFLNMRCFFLLKNFKRLFLFVCFLKKYLVVFVKEMLFIVIFFMCLLVKWLFLLVMLYEVLGSYCKKN